MTRVPFVALLIVLAGAGSMLVRAQAPQGSTAYTAGPTRTPVFRQERPVQPGGAGPNVLTLDAWALLNGQPFAIEPRPRAEDHEPSGFASRGLGDLRLYDRANREVPYLLVPPEWPARDWIRATDVQPIAPTKTTSGFEVSLTEALLIDGIQIDGLAAPFLKRVRLEGSGDRARWTMLAEQATLFDLPDQQLRQTEVTFPAGEYRYLRVTWDDRNSAVVAMPSAFHVRRRDASGTEPAPFVLPLQVERRPSEPGRSRYRIVLPVAGLPIYALEIQANDPNILRPARVTEPRLAGARLEPFELGAARLRRASFGDATTGPLRLPILLPAGRTIDLVVHDGSNQPLDLTGVAAVLAPLPSIYFDSADGAPLVARLGDPRANAPAYDLEAMRPNLSKLHMIAASWGEAAALPEATAAANDARDPLGASGMGSVVDTTTFRFARDVPDGPAGLTALHLDGAALAHSRLVDLRLVDREGRQRPYLLESRDEPLAIALESPSAGAAPAWMSARDTSRTPGTRTIYRLRLPDSPMPESRLVLTTDARVFRRGVTVFAEPAQVSGREQPSAARQLTSANWSHANQDDSAPPLELQLPRIDTTEIVVEVDEGDNAPLRLASARLLLPGYALRFVRTDAAPLTLHYGSDAAQAPRYDLALLQPYLVGAPATELTPGPERSRPPVEPVRMPPWIFWSVLIAAVLALLLLIRRLLRAEPPAATA